LLGDRADLERIRFGAHDAPHRLLGPHPTAIAGRDGVVVRAFHPEARTAFCLLENGEERLMRKVAEGLFAVFLPGTSAEVGYRLRFHCGRAGTVERGDPYRFAPTVPAADAARFAEGEHPRPWEMLGAHPMRCGGVDGTAFSVWAPAARRVSVIGDFCGWDGRHFPMRRVPGSGIFELFVPGVGAGAEYQLQIRTEQGAVITKTDPFATAIEADPTPRARVTESTHTWSDAAWMDQRQAEPAARRPMVVYEVHLGSWARAPEGSQKCLGYRELAPRLVEHARSLGVTHLEVLPVAEHALYSSWGYQVTSPYAPTARHGSPDDFRYFVDYCHQHGMGVILDWVPVHFPKDEVALARFDGTPLFEGTGSPTEWGTLAFDHARPEVRNYLVANALYWLEQFHLDGLRVDAVAVLLGQHYYGARSEPLDPAGGGAEFLRALNQAIRDRVPGALTIAEDSTAWPGVTRPVGEGGLGFDFKWNMGWMHDTLAHFSRPPEQRSAHQNELLFAMSYEHDERFINALSHDEVVHGKGSLVEKMPGDLGHKLANLRLLLTYQYTRPGKVLWFMGTEVAQAGEWDHDSSIDWAAGEDPERQGLHAFLVELGRLYHDASPLWRRDADPEGFEWLAGTDSDPGVLAFVRRDGDNQVIVVMNLGDAPRASFRLGVPEAGQYRIRLRTDDVRFGGSGFAQTLFVVTEPVAAHGRPQSIDLELPALAALVLVPA
jgi:1,4-alpha-glucan branching enzyme